jgi:branched-chain amino acid transport system permease protein
MNALASGFFMPFIQTPNLNIHYELAGEGQTNLVLVHGNFASWRWWRPVLERLPAGYQAYAPDLRGCGDTDQPLDGYNIPQLTQDLHAFVNAMQLPSFHLVGHSLGGAVALQFILDYPDLVQTLTLVAPAPAQGLSFFDKPDQNSPWLSYLFDLRRETSLNLLETNYRLLRTLDANRPLLQRAIHRMAPTLNHDHTFQALVDDAARMAPEAMMGYLQSLEIWNVEAELEHIQQPVLILAGGQDKLIPLPALKSMVKSLPQGKLTRWEKVGHAPQLEQPKRFVKLLQKFTTPKPISIKVKSLNFMRRIQQIFERMKRDFTKGIP